ncbi:MAG: hypothetical protein HY805_09265 [Nitrospirae bacterium]|nr:hypothetical protein [Nitrospirota bacterium]
MTKGSEKNRELVFRVYREAGGKGVRDILGRLEKEHGIKISSQTLRLWKKEGRWDERIDRGRGLDEEMVIRLLRLIKKYERYLEACSGVDTQAAYAYINMIRAVSELQRKMPKRIDPERMKEVAQEILETEFGIKRGNG